MIKPSKSQPRDTKAPEATKRDAAPVTDAEPIADAERPKAPPPHPLLPEEHRHQ